MKVRYKSNKICSEYTCRKLYNTGERNQTFSNDKWGEKTLESPLDCKEIQPVHSEGDQPGISLEGMMLKLKLQYFGHLI